MTIDYDEVLRDIGELGTKSHPLLCIADIVNHKINIISIEIVYLSLSTFTSKCRVKVRPWVEGTWQKRMFLLLSIPSATSAMAVFMYDFIGERATV